MALQQKADVPGVEIGQISALQRKFVLDAIVVCSMFVLMQLALSAAPPLDMIETMTRCAYELGLAASEIALQAKNDTARFLSASAEFRHCFFAVRMGLRLKLAERAAARSARAAPAPERLERERADSLDPPERERDDSVEPLEVERERDRDYEPVSLPQFLKSLRVAAAQAERRRDELPAHIRDTTLPTLRTLLRDAKAPARPAQAPAIAVVFHPSGPPAGRSRLLSSTRSLSLAPTRPGLRRSDSG